MADKQTGKTDKPEAVEIEVTDAASLADALQATMELEVPQDDTPKDATTEVAEDDGNDEVLSQTEEETEAEAEPAADDSAEDADDGEDAGEVDANDAEDSPDDPNRGYQKRIDKLTKRAKGAEEKIASLEADLAAKKARRGQKEQARKQQRVAVAKGLVQKLHAKRKQAAVYKG